MARNPTMFVLLFLESIFTPPFVPPCEGGKERGSFGCGYAALCIERISLDKRRLIHYKYNRVNLINGA